LLAARRFTETQLWRRLAQKEFDDDEIRATVAWCKSEGYLDDALFARLYVEGRRKAVGDARLVGELVLRGVEREAAQASVARSDSTQEDRLERALDQLFRNRPACSYAGAARRLERLGFPAAAIYRHLRAHASRFADGMTTSEDSYARAE
jgi:SOS response regulatory protein OraA/RecX